MNGFTLVELLAVLGVMTILLVLIGPAVGPLLQGTQLTQAGDLVLGQLALARQQALTNDQVVEVRIYQYALGGATMQYQSLQVFSLLASGTYMPLGKVQPLPNSIIFDVGTGNSSTTLSSIISMATAAAPPTLVTGASLNVPIPGLGLNYNAVTFQFRPDGSTNLPLTTTTNSGQWFLTLHNVTNGDGLATSPKNFYCIQIDSYNGHARTFRP